MRREKNYNRHHGSEEYWQESPPPRRRPQVTKGESVYGDHRPPNRDPYGEPPRRKAVRAIPRDEQWVESVSDEEYFNEDTYGGYDEDYDDFYDDPAYFTRKQKKQYKKQAKKQRKAYKKAEKRGRRKKRPLLKILLLLLVVFLAFWFYMTSNLNSHPLPKDNGSLGITNSGRIGVTNIALFGVDARDGSDTGRSDAIMVVTVDMIRGDLKMTSLLRDSKVAVEGHGNNKLNHAYAYGGPELAVKTINQNFDLDIREFVTVNFNQLAEIVDAVGGVTIDVTEEERQQINYNMSEIDLDHPQLEASGTVVLDGPQAVAYSRIRKIDSDNARTDRQQEVLNAVFVSVKTMSPIQFPKFVHDFSEIVDTSMSSLDVLKVAPILIRNPELETYTIPDIQYETDLWGGIDSSGMWCWHYDLEPAAARMNEIAFGN